MINRTLYQKEWKTNWILLIIFIGVLTMYAVMIIAMFDPEMGDSLRIMAASMPQIFAAFGMADVGTTLLDFVAGYLYGMLLIAFPAVYIIILSNRLVARYVDNGSMAYLLAVPEKRKNIVGTQAIFLFTSLFVMLVYVMAVILVTSWFMFPGELAIPEFIRVNIGMFGLWIMTGGIAFFGSCLFNETKLALGMSSAFVIYSLLIQMISQVGDKFEVLKYITPFTLFDIDGLTAGNGGAWIACGVMYAAGILFFVAGIEVFKKKNLPI
ncbi:MAG: ABC transporter permease [Lachnospiraceae bacterium]|nr:ABC transporter permease [Lachnospiraceae bacterium]